MYSRIWQRSPWQPVLAQLHVLGAVQMPEFSQAGSQIATGNNIYNNYMTLIRKWLKL